MIVKQNVNINFAQGLDQKSDPKQVPIGKFLRRVNSVFTKMGLMKKRNGYGPLPPLPDSTSTYLTTFVGNLTAIGRSLLALDFGAASWVNKGTFQPISLSVIPTARGPVNQTQCDSVTAPNGLVCTVYTENNGGTLAYKYVILDGTTTQNIIAPTVIPVSSGTVTGSPRVFLLGAYFIIVFTNVITAVSHLQYIAVSSLMPTVVTANADIASAYISATTLSWDGVVVGSNLFVAYNTTSGGQQIKVTYLSSSFTVAAAQSFAGSICTLMGICADLTNPASPKVYVSFYDAAGSTGYVIGLDQNLNKTMTPTQIISSGTVKNMTCTAQSGVVQVVYEVLNAYSYDANIGTNYLDKVAVTAPTTLTTGTVGSTTVLVRSVGLASKSFLMNSTMYMLTAYDGKSTSVAAFQPTYFLINLSGQVVAKLAYQNGGGYLTLGLPQAQVQSSLVKIPYLFKDLIQSVNKTQGLANAVGIYSQTGVNLSSMTFSDETLSTAELGQNLNLSGGFLYAYDGQTINEQNFHLYPDSVEAVVSHSGGSMTVQDYFYQAVYEWTDSQGNIFRSAPSVPVKAPSASFSGSSNSVTVNVPYARLTYKSGVKIVIYRWSTAQESYFQVTSITAPTLNDTTADSVAFVDTLADASILGNSLLYTTGGVVENTGTPACTALTLFDTRLWAIDAEDQNLLLFSKQVVEGTPVEMSDLFSKYIAPNAGTQTDTGPMRVLFPMDDKLVILKKDALFYINGTGPDNTGANSQYSEPIFITSTIGSINLRSIVFIPQGLLFQSDNGIWLLGRDLSTDFKGWDVQDLTDGALVVSANQVPGTNEVRFVMDSGVTILYDYSFDKWATFEGVPGVAATVYQGKHTYVNSGGQVFQETPGLYLDNGNPVLMSLTTGWLNLAGLQGYMRAFFFYILGDYITPHKLSLGISYDYEEAVTQALVISPTNFAPAYGGPNPGVYGDGTPYGGPGKSENWRVFLTRQRCSAFRISLTEIYDPSFGIPAGEGLSLSGINLVYGVKKGFRPISAANSAGGQS